MLRLILILTTTLALVSAKSQVQGEYPHQLYDDLKADGKSTDDQSLVPAGPVFGTHPSTLPGTSGNRSSCDCYVAPDTSYTLALLPNDDGSSAAIPIPFNFCMYGTNYNSVYINNNGNISFGAPYPTYSPAGFPNTAFVMVAPFWGDVDTRNGNGEVWYKITPTAVYVNWVGVGYYNQHGDKLNTFQVIITDGADPAVPNGGNVAFCYEDMQWTTGDASSGVNGFGGVPAIVGVNKGNGIDYVQFGAFDQPGIAYDGPGGNNDGVDWLDQQSLFFDVCAAVNIPPVFSNFGLGGNVGAGGGNSCGADTIKICATDDTLLFAPSFLGPEIGDSVTVTVNFNGMTNASVIASNPGNPGNAVIQLIGDATNVGYNYIDIIGTDDGSPQQTTTISLVVLVDTSGSAYMNPTIYGDSIACDSIVIGLDSAYTYDSYMWNIVPSDSTVLIDSSGTYYVTAERNDCYKSVQKTITVVESPVPVELGNSLVCPGDSNLYTVDLTASTGLPYDSLNWGNGMDTAQSAYLTPGNYTLDVIDTNGCSGTTSFIVYASTPLNINSTPQYHCNTLSGMFNFGLNNGTFGGNWTFEGPAGATATFTPANSLYPNFTVSEPGAYMFIYTDLCGDMDTANVIFDTDPYVALSDSFFCSDIIPPYTLAPDSLSGGISYAWNVGDTTSTIVVDSAGTYIITVTNGCGSSTDTSFVENIQLEVPTDTAVCGLAYVFDPDSVSSPAGGFWSYSGPTANDTIEFVPGNGVDAPTIFASDYGFYTLTYTDSLCNVDKSMEIQFKKFAWTDLVADTICVGTSITLNAFQSQNDTYLWNTGSSSSSIVVSDSGWYSVTVENECNSHYEEVYIPTVVCDCWIPNIITTNGDGQNDFLFIDCIQYVESNRIEIFNRWGGLVYSKDNYNNDWYGTSNAGDRLNDGTYFYILYIHDTDKVYKGFIQVLNN